MCAFNAEQGPHIFIIVQSILLMILKFILYTLKGDRCSEKSLLNTLVLNEVLKTGDIM